MSFAMYTAAERPGLWERGISSQSVWPEYNLHGDVLNLWWGHLDEELADFQFVLYDEAQDEVVAEGHTGPLWWSGSDEALPDGIDAAIELIFSRSRAGKPVNTLCALAAESPREGRSRGLAVQPRWIPGCASTNASARGSRHPCRGRWASPGRSTSGRRGRGWPSPSLATMCSPKGWRRFTSTGRRTAGPTGSRTSGWSTRTWVAEHGIRVSVSSPPAPVSNAVSRLP